MKRAAILAVSLLLTAPLSAAELWIHFRAEERDGNRHRVVVNLPVKAIERALPLIPTDIADSCDLRLNGSRIRPAQLRAVVQNLRAAPSGTEVPLPEEQITVRRSGDLLVFTSQSRWDDSRGSLSVPFDLAETLLGRDDEIDLRGAVDLLVRRGQGEIMMIDNDDQTFRIWVDSSPAAPLRQNIAAARPKGNRQ